MFSLDRVRTFYKMGFSELMKVLDNGHIPLCWEMHQSCQMSEFRGEFTACLVKVPYFTDEESEAERVVWVGWQTFKRLGRLVDGLGSVKP